MSATIDYYPTSQKRWRIIDKLEQAGIDAVLRHYAEAEKAKLKFKLIYFKSGFKLLFGHEKTHKFL